MTTSVDIYSAMPGAKSTPFEAAMDRVILDRLSSGAFYQPVGLVTAFQGTATPTQVRAAIDQLTSRGRARVYGAAGHAYVRRLR